MRDVTTVRPASGTDTLPPTTPEPSRHRRALVLGSRTALVMLLVAAVALAALGLAVLAFGDPPEVTGWLRSVFGTVFGAMAVGIALVLGIPAAAGVWEMSGASTRDAAPALPPAMRRVMGGIAITALVIAGITVLALGDRVTILDVALVGLAALPTLGLAGALACSPHRGRALLAAAALSLVSAGIVWVAMQVGTVAAG